MIVYNNISHNRGLVLLHNACSYRHYDVAELLLEVVMVMSVDDVIFFANHLAV